jgi:Fur family ferric uptake transcriptional regulator
MERTLIPDLPRPKDPSEQILKRQKLSEKQFRQMIRDMNLKVTEQRLLILRALHEGRAHVTAQEVFEAVVAEDSTVGFATVYRFLKKLHECHLVTEVRMGGLPSRYELTPAAQHHDHLTCTQCGKICEFENRDIELLQIQVAKKFGFVLTSHVLELYGLCENCQTQSR